MVKHFGYCPSLRKKVDFEVSEVVDIPTKRGIKYQIKGNYEGRLCNTFCSASKAQELRTQIGSPKVFTVMEAEESQENLAQATQEESVPPIIGPSEKAYGQEGEAAQELPLAQTMPTPIISADDMSVQPIDDLSLPDATLADMQETLDVPPTMDADFEIAEIQPEGDGSSIGNIAPMNPDAPLHAEDFDAEESQENLGQATQEESVPAIIGPSEKAYGQEGEAAQELPLAETVPTPIISAVDMNIVSNDSLSSFNGGDILNQMESDLGERPEIMADFAIRPYQLFGQGRSIGNIAPMNPDVPFASEDDDDEVDMNKIANMQKYFMEKLGLDDDEQLEEYFEKMDNESDDDNFDAESLSQFDIELMAQVPPPVCFAEKIPPSVWENTTIQDQLDYASSKNEGLLDCPQCGISKAELRNQGGYCGTTDPESEEYISSRSCPYEKYFAPQHWIDEPQVISHITPERIVLEDTLMAEMDMPATDPIMAGVETRFIPKGLFYQINSMLPDGVVANQTIDGMGYELSYYGMDTEALDKIIDSQSQGYDIMFGAETFDAESKKKPSKTAEKAILTGASTGATMEIADALLAAEGERSFTLNYGPKRMYVVIEYNDGKELFMQDYKQFVEELNEAEATGDEELIESLFGVGSDYHNIAEEDFDMGGPNSTPYEAETFEAEQCKHEEYYVIGMDGDEWNEGGENFAMLEIECESCGVRGKGETNLSYDTAPNREHNRIWWEDIGFEAETFGVEFDDWADQEMKSHGENVSFKKWAKEEGEKHGDVPLTDWAEHEEESHDERYGAEEYEILISDNNMDFGDSYNSFNDEQGALEEAWKLSQKETDMFVYVRRNDGKVIRVFRPYGAETFDAEEDEWVGGDNGEQIYWSHPSGYQVIQNKIGGLIFIVNENGGYQGGNYSNIDDAIRNAERMISKAVADGATDGWEVFAYRPTEKEAIDARNEGMRAKVGRRQLRFDYKIEKASDKEGWNILARPRNQRAETFESQSAQTSMKPPIKSIGILLGLGAIAAVVAPENLKKMFKR